MPAEIVPMPDDEPINAVDDPLICLAGYHILCWSQGDLVYLDARRALLEDLFCVCGLRPE